MTCSARRTCWSSSARRSSTGSPRASRPARCPTRRRRSAGCTAASRRPCGSTSISFELAGSSAAPRGTTTDGAAAEIGNDYLLRQVSTLGGGTTEMARNVISERVLGMPRELSYDRNTPFRDVPKGPPVQVAEPVAMSEPGPPARSFAHRWRGLSAGDDADAGGAGGAVELGVADLRVAGDLAVAGLAAQLLDEFVDLAQARRTDRLAVGDQAAVGVDRQRAVDVRRPVGEQSLPGRRRRRSRSRPCGTPRRRRRCPAAG